MTIGHLQSMRTTTLALSNYSESFYEATRIFFSYLA